MLLRPGKKDEGAHPGLGGRFSGEDIGMAGIHIKENSQADKQNDRKSQNNLDPKIILDAVLEDDQNSRSPLSQK